MQKCLRYIGYGAIYSMLVIGFSCTKMDHTYEKFIAGGPIVYPGRPDSVLTFGGRERVLLQWAVPTDLNVVKYKVFWNFGADSLMVTGPKPGTADSMSVIIDSVPEGSYSFSVYTYDQAGHKSVATSSIGNSYGEIFQESIANRIYRKLKLDAKQDTLAAVWVGLDAKCIGTEWVYTGTDGQAKNYFSPIDTATYIHAIDVSQPISYRSLFLPEVDAIDTFYTDLKIIQ